MELKIDFSDEKQKRKLYEHLKTLKGKKWVTIDSATRSVGWNRYYWKVVVGLIADHIGEQIPMQVHMDLCLLFLPEFNREYHAGIWFERGRTSKLTNERFGEFVFKVQTWAASFLGLYIPDPHEVIDI